MTEEKKSAAVKCPLLTSSSYTTFPGKTTQILLVKEEAELIREAVRAGDKVFLTSLNDKTGAYNKIGTIGSVLEFQQDADGGIITFKAEKRARLLDDGIDVATNAAVAKVEVLEDSLEADAEMGTLANLVMNEFEKLAHPNSMKDQRLVENMRTVAKLDPSLLPDAMAPLLNLSPDQEQELLETLDTKERLQLLYAHLAGAQVMHDASRKMQDEMDKKNREFVIKKQIEQLQKQLGDGEGEEDELEAMSKKVKESGMSEEALKKCEDAIKRMKTMNPGDAEAQKLMYYLEWMTSVPWNKKSELTGDLKTSQEILDNDHYGLDDVKKRIVQHLAVQQRTGESNGTIICLLGPPGVGKTSIGKSIAKATGREFLRISLGGVDDESAVRGHRRTYVGSEPGVVISSMKKAGTTNPVVQLDEIDKMGKGGGSGGGDPTAAMLELLDPAQNNAFKDHYLDVEYDMSNAMFVCTANDLSQVPRPLLDRMEIIEIAGYTDDEKMEIAKRHLMPKALETNGVKEGEFSLSDDGLQRLISEYTREAGVRNLEREINTLMREALMEIETGGVKAVAITAENLEKYAGQPKVTHDRVSEVDEVGCVNGLYVSGAGGGILPLVAVKFPSVGGAAVATGSLQQVMQESVSDAYDFVRSNASELGISLETLQSQTLHIKAGDGSTPKDGPSAGLALTTLIVSTLTGIPVRADVAMTGEVGLHGASMPIGGVKQKLLGAYQAGAKKVLIPEANVKDLVDVPQKVKDGLEIVAVKNVMEVLQHALVEMPKPLAAEEKHDNTADVDATLVAAFAAALSQSRKQGPARMPANDVAPQPAAVPSRVAKAFNPRP